MGADRELQENLAYDYGCSSGSPLKHAVAFLSKMNSSVLGIVCYLNRDNPVPNCPNSYASIARKETQHTMCRWYRQFISLGYRLSGRTAVRWSGILKVERSRLTQCIKSCDLQPSLHCSMQYMELRGYCPV